MFVFLTSQVLKIIAKFLTNCISFGTYIVAMEFHTDQNFMSFAVPKICQYIEIRYV